MQIWLKERQLTKYIAERDAAIRDAIKLKKSSDVIEKIDQDWEYDVRSTSEEVDALKSAKLLRRANKCDIPHPTRERTLGYWEQGYFSHKWYLTVAGRAALRAEIRREHRERRERWGWLIPVIFGLIGSLTGLASILLKK